MRHDVMPAFVFAPTLTNRQSSVTMKYYRFLLVLACFPFAGCSGKDGQNEVLDNSLDPIVMDELPLITRLEGHPEHGPHGGELIELGQEAFHIEMTHGTGVVSMYVLDDSATQLVSIEAEGLMVSLKHNGEVKAFELSADPQTQDEPGTASRFTSNLPELDQWFGAGAEGVVTLPIDGKSYTGKIFHDHDHDHEGHSHKH